MINKPTCNQLLELTPVDSRVLDDWRWGTIVEDFFEFEGSFWSAVYRRTPDNEVNGLREGEADLYRVEKQTVTREEWFHVPEEKCEPES